MPRPSSPLISHDAVVGAALHIVDREGLDAFSLPRLARELNVQAPSLYHHFADRADILRTVARAIVLQTRLPDPAACATWVDWFVGLSMAFRNVVLSHRNAAPILLEFMPRDLLIENYELCIQILAEIGVPPSQRILVINGLDTLTLGASLAEAAKSPATAGQVFASVGAATEPMLAQALAANTRTAQELFADSIRSFLAGAVPGVPPEVPAPQALIARFTGSRSRWPGVLTAANSGLLPRLTRGVAAPRAVDTTSRIQELRKCRPVALALPLCLLRTRSRRQRTAPGMPCSAT